MATNVVAIRPPERRPTATPTARANLYGGLRSSGYKLNTKDPFLINPQNSIKILSTWKFHYINLFLTTHNKTTILLPAPQAPLDWYNESIVQLGLKLQFQFQVFAQSRTLYSLCYPTQPPITYLSKTKSKPKSFPS